MIETTIEKYKLANGQVLEYIRKEEFEEIEGQGPVSLCVMEQNVWLTGKIVQPGAEEEAAHKATYLKKLQDFDNERAARVELGESKESLDAERASIADRAGKTLFQIKSDLYENYKPVKVS